MSLELILIVWLAVFIRSKTGKLIVSSNKVVRRIEWVTIYQILVSKPGPWKAGSKW